VIAPDPLQSIDKSIVWLQKPARSGGSAGGRLWALYVGGDPLMLVGQRQHPSAQTRRLIGSANSRQRCACCRKYAFWLSTPTIGIFTQGDTGLGVAKNWQENERFAGTRALTTVPN